MKKININIDVYIYRNEITIKIDVDDYGEQIEPDLIGKILDRAKEAYNGIQCK